MVSLTIHNQDSNFKQLSDQILLLDTEQIANTLRYALIKINDETIIGEDNRRAEDYEFVNYKVAHKI